LVSAPLDPTYSGDRETPLAEHSSRDRLIVALDCPRSRRRARSSAGSGRRTFYKIGLELVMAGGLDLARELAHAGCQVFLDMKLLDIENTVERLRAMRPRPAPPSSPCTRTTPRRCVPR